MALVTDSMDEVPKNEKPRDEVPRSELPILIQLSKKRAKKTFKSPDDLNDFIDLQQKSYKFSNEELKGKNEQTIGKFIWDRFYQPLIASLKQIANVWQTNGPNLDSSIESFETSYSDFHVPFSNSSLGRYVLKHTKKSPIESLLISFSSLCPNHNPTSNPAKQMYDSYTLIIGARVNGDNDPNYKAFKALEGQYSKAQRLLTAYEIFGSKNAAQSQIDIVNSVIDDTYSLYSDATKKKTNFDKWLKNEQTSVETLKKDKTKLYEQDFSNSVKKILKTKRAITNRVNTDIQSSLDRLKIAEDTYNSKIELSASVAYWETKKVTHQTELKTWLIAVIAFSTLTVILPPALGYLVTGWTEKLFTDKLLLGAINPLALTTTVILLSLCTYAIRFSSRQYSSAKHLMLEAVERKTMISTYLALMNEDKLKEQEDRKIALDTLFRPSSTGIIADNTAIMPTDAVIKIFDKRTS